MPALTLTYRDALAAARDEAVAVLRAALRRTEPDADGNPVPTDSARLAACALLRFASTLPDDAEPDTIAAADPAPEPRSTPAAGAAAPHHAPAHTHAGSPQLPTSTSSAAPALIAAAHHSHILSAAARSTPASALLMRAGALRGRAPTSFAPATTAPPLAPVGRPSFSSG